MATELIFLDEWSPASKPPVDPAYEVKVWSRDRGVFVAWYSTSLGLWFEGKGDLVFISLWKEIDD